MSMTIVFSSPVELARFLWGEPEETPRSSPTYPVLIQAKDAWMRQKEEGGAERLEQALLKLDKCIRDLYFYPPHDPVTTPGIPRNLVVIGYYPQIEGAGVYFSLCSVDPMSDVDTVNYLKVSIDRAYGEGFFARHIVSVNRVSQKPMLEKRVTFGAASCEVNEEVV